MSHGLNSKRIAYGLKLPWANVVSFSKRADDRVIAEDVIEALSHCPSLEGDQIEVQVRNGSVTLNGKVASRENRRLAADAAWSVYGVSDVLNLLATAEKA